MHTDVETETIDDEFQPVAIRGYLPAPALCLAVSKEYGSATYRIDYGDRYETGLTRGEVLEIVSASLATGDVPYLKNESEHRRFGDWCLGMRRPSGPVVSCPRCTRANFGVSTHHAPPVCGY